MKIIKLSIVLFLTLITGCSTLVLQPADFAWPVESVVKVDDSGNVSIDRYSVTFDSKNLFFEETGDSLAYLDRELHILRDTKGFYFLTADKFKNVYVFTADDGTLKLNNKIQISETGMKNPLFNQRTPYIELITDTGKLYLSNNGIEKEEQ